MTTAHRLRLLGGVALERGDGAPVSGRAAQKRRLALLSLLALAPGRTLSRDRLLAYLWPESDTEQARHLLTVAVYEARKALGDDAIITRGDELELSGTLLRTDVEAFEASVKAARWEDAATIYAGPFLDGFFVADAPDFERWVDGERERLARMYASALESLARARAHNGDTAGALDAWHRLAAVDPYNAHHARELMLALDAAGDRAGAIRHARTHATLLREEFGAEPDPEVEALAARLRSAPVSEPNVRAPVPVAPPAHVPDVHALPDVILPAAAAPSYVSVTSDVSRAWMRARAPAIAVILLLTTVAAFALWDRRDSSATGDCSEQSIIVQRFESRSAPTLHPFFGDGMADAVLTALSTVNCLKVFARTTAFEVSGDDSDAVARSLNARYLLSGTWQGDTTDNWLKVVPSLVDARTKELKWSKTYEFRGTWTTHKLDSIRQEIARDVARELSVPLGTAGNVARAVPNTDNIAAYHAFDAGSSLLQRRNIIALIQAEQSFKKAIEYDPDFAAARAALAETTALLGAYDYGVRVPREAYPAAEREAKLALERDSMLAEAHATLGSVHFNHYYDWPAAEAAYRRAIRLKRGYSQAYHWYSLMLVALARPEDALEQLRLGLALDPNSVILRAAVARNHYFTRDFERAVAGYEAAIRQDDAFVPARLGLGLSLAHLGRFDEAITAFEQAERILRGSAPVTDGLLGYAYGRAGRTTDARARLARLQHAAANVYVPAEYFALVHVGLGEHEQAIDALYRAYENRSGGVAYLGIEPILDPLRTHPRFKQLLETLRL